MNIILFGTSHKYLEVEKREKISFLESELELSIHDLTKVDGICEATILSTCNRVEFILIIRKDIELFEEIRKFLIKTKGTDINHWKDQFYMYSNDEAVRHIFRVSSSIDSMVIGEADILHQIKENYAFIRQTFPYFFVLDRLLHAAINTGKRVRNETAIGAGKVSVSSTAVEFIKNKTKIITDKKFLIIGAGKMGVSMARYLKKNGANDITIVNRTEEKAKKAAKELNIKTGLFEHYKLLIASVDFVLVSVHYDGYLLNNDIFEILNSSVKKPVLILDISVPRVVEEYSSDNIIVEDIESLNEVLQENEKNRMSAIIQVNRIIEDNIRRFSQWAEELVILPSVIELRQNLRDTMDILIDKKAKNIPPEYRQDLEEFGLAMTNKIIQTPIEFLRDKVVRKKETEYLAYFQKFFRLTEENDSMENLRNKQKGDLRIISSDQKSKTNSRSS